MHKVVVERPRWNPGPGENGRRANRPDEQLPKFEGIKRPHRMRKGLTDLLGPQRRWLQAQVGRPWNDVYSEACSVIKPDSVIRQHIKTHLLEFVERHTFMHEGIVCVLKTGYGQRRIMPVTEIWSRWQHFYVHPETGMLMAIPETPRSATQTNPADSSEIVHQLGNGLVLQQISGLWFQCKFQLVPVDVRFKAYDHALERVVSRRELTRHDKQYYLCVNKQQLSRRELKKFGLTNNHQMERSLQPVIVMAG